MSSLSLYDIYNIGKDVQEPPQFGLKINKETILTKEDYMDLKDSNKLSYLIKRKSLQENISYEKAKQRIKLKISKIKKKYEDSDKKKHVNNSLILKYLYNKI